MAVYLRDILLPAPEFCSSLSLIFSVKETTSIWAAIWVACQVSGKLCYFTWKTGHSLMRLPLLFWVPSEVIRLGPIDFVDWIFIIFQRECLWGQAWGLMDQGKMSSWFPGRSGVYTKLSSCPRSDRCAMRSSVFAIGQAPQDRRPGQCHLKISGHSFPYWIQEKYQSNWILGAFSVLFKTVLSCHG